MMGWGQTGLDVSHHDYRRGGASLLHSPLTLCGASLLLCLGLLKSFLYCSHMVLPAVKYQKTPKPRDFYVFEDMVSSGIGLLNDSMVLSGWVSQKSNFLWIKLTKEDQSHSMFDGFSGTLLRTAGSESFSQNSDGTVWHLKHITIITEILIEMFKNHFTGGHKLDENDLFREKKWICLVFPHQPEVLSHPAFISNLHPPPTLMEAELPVSWRSVLITCWMLLFHAVTVEAPTGETATWLRLPAAWCASGFRSEHASLRLPPLSHVTQSLASHIVFRWTWSTEICSWNSTLCDHYRAAEATEEVTRLRPPRLIKEDGIIRPYDLTESQGFDLFQVWASRLELFYYGNVFYCREIVWLLFSVSNSLKFKSTEVLWNVRRSCKVAVFKYRSLFSYCFGFMLWSLIINTNL